MQATSPSTTNLILRPAVLLILSAIACPALAEEISVEPDDYAIGTDLSTIVSGVTFSVEAQPNAVVVSVIGSSGACGPDPQIAVPCASTDTQVFGATGLSPKSAPWQQNSGEFRADFDQLTDFVSIDLVGVDDGPAQLRAFRADGTHLQTFLANLSGPGHNVTASISRASPDIAYILAGGVIGERNNLDNFRFNRIAPPFPTAILLSGPLVEDGLGGLVLGLNHGEVGIGLDHAQYYLYSIEIENGGSSDNSAYLDALGGPFELSAVGEDLDTFGVCGSDVCDGIIADADCEVTLSGPPIKKNAFEPKFIVVQPKDGFVGTCTTTIYLATRSGSGRSKGNKSTVFEPTECQSAILNDETDMINTVSLNEGIKVFDESSGDLTSGPHDSIQLFPVGCP